HRAVVPPHLHHRSGAELERPQRRAVFLERRVLLRRRLDQIVGVVARGARGEDEGRKEQESSHGRKGNSEMLSSEMPMPKRMFFDTEKMATAPKFDAPKGMRATSAPVKRDSGNMELLLFTWLPPTAVMTALGTESSTWAP